MREDETELPVQGHPGLQDELFLPKEGETKPGREGNYRGKDGKGRGKERRDRVTLIHQKLRVRAQGLTAS